MEVLVSANIASGAIQARGTGELGGSRSLSLLPLLPLLTGITIYWHVCKYIFRRRYIQVTLHPEDFLLFAK